MQRSSLSQTKWDAKQPVPWFLLPKHPSFCQQREKRSSLLQSVLSGHAALHSNTPHRARQDERHDITRPNKARHRGDQAPASLPWPAPGRKQLTWVFKQYWLGRAGRLLGGAAAHGLPETPPALPAPKGPWRNEGRTLRLSTQKNRLQA